MIGGVHVQYVAFPHFRVRMVSSAPWGLIHVVATTVLTCPAGRQYQILNDLPTQRSQVW